MNREFKTYIECPSMTHAGESITKSKVGSVISQFSSEKDGFFVPVSDCQKIFWCCVKVDTGDFDTVWVVVPIHRFIALDATVDTLLDSVEKQKTAWLVVVDNANDIVKFGTVEVTEISKLIGAN